MRTLEAETTLAGTVGHGLDYAVVQKSGSIKDNLLNALFASPFREYFAQRTPLRHPAVVGLTLEIGRERRQPQNGLTDFVVYDLRFDVPQRSAHYEARSHGGAVQRLSRPSPAACASYLFAVVSV